VIAAHLSTPKCPMMRVLVFQSFRHRDRLVAAALDACFRGIVSWIGSPGQKEGRMAERQEANAVTEGKNEVSEVSTTSGPSESRDYVVPVVKVHVPGALVNAGFWGGLAGAVVLGVVDPPLGVLVGAAVVVARHQR
jgi:hypothetical protein